MSDCPQSPLAEQVVAERDRALKAEAMVAALREQLLETAQKGPHRMTERDKAREARVIRETAQVAREHDDALIEKCAQVVEASGPQPMRLNGQRAKVAARIRNLKRGEEES